MLPFDRFPTSGTICLALTSFPMDFIKHVKARGEGGREGRREGGHNILLLAKHVQSLSKIFGPLKSSNTLE